MCEERKQERLLLHEEGVCMISYQDMLFLRARYLGPESPPQNEPDIAPFPLWLIPPIWRCARRDDIQKAIDSFHEDHQGVSREEGQETPQELARWFGRMDVEWNHAVPLEEWGMRDGDEVLIVWKHGKRASQRSPFSREHTPFPLLTAWYTGALEQPWQAEKALCQSSAIGTQNEFEVGERAAVHLCIRLSQEEEELEKLTGQLVQVYGEVPGGTDACFDFYGALQAKLSERTLAPYREVMREMCGSRALMDAEIAYRAQLDGQKGG
jgi:hypothetical protein